VILALTFVATVSAQTQQILHQADRIVPLASLDSWSQRGWKFHGNDGAVYEAQWPVRWGVFRGIVGHQAVWLSDGSWIAGKIFLVNDHHLEIRHDWLDVTTIPLAAVRAVLLQPSASLRDWMEWQVRFQQLQGDQDVVWLGNERQVAGVIQWSQLSSNAQSLTMTISNRTHEVPSDQIAAIGMSPALLEPILDNQKSLRMGLDAGTLLNVTDVASAGQRLTFNSFALGKVTTLESSQKFIKAVNFLSADQIPGVEFLSHQTPSTYRFLSETELKFELGTNRGVDGDPLLVGGASRGGMVFSGLEMHSSAQVAYRLESYTGKLLTEARLAHPLHSSSRLGHVRCKILTSTGDTLQVAQEFTLGRGIADVQLKTIEVELNKAKMIALVVEKAEQGQWADRVQWLDARLVR
jgi:hypothetical protein